MIQYGDDTELDQDFIRASEEVKHLPKRPTDRDLLLLYGLYKQANEGSCKESQKPPIYDLKNTAKWNAWSANSGMSKNRAKTEYISLVENFRKKYA